MTEEIQEQLEFNVRPTGETDPERLRKLYELIGEGCEITVQIGITKYSNTKHLLTGKAEGTRSRLEKFLSIIELLANMMKGTEHSALSSAATGVIKQMQFQITVGDEEQMVKMRTLLVKLSAGHRISMRLERSSVNGETLGLSGKASGLEESIKNFADTIAALGALMGKG